MLGISVTRFSQEIQVALLGTCWEPSGRPNPVHVPNDSRDLRIPPSIRGGSRRREGRLREQFDDEAITVARFLNGKAEGETIARIIAEVANDHVGAAARIRASGLSDREWLAL